MASSLEQKKTVRILAGALLWILCLQFFVAERVVAHAWTTPYSWASNLVSDLGATQCALELDPPLCSPLHMWMNISFLLQGVLIACGALLVRPAFNAKLGNSVAIGLAVVCGVGVFWVGIAPEDVAPSLHHLAAGVHFFFGGVAVVTFGGVFLTPPARRWPEAVLSLLLGLPVLGTALLLAVGGGEKWPQGQLERVAAYGIPLWFVLMGLAILARGARPAPPVPRMHLPPPPPPRAVVS